MKRKFNVGDRVSVTGKPCGLDWSVSHSHGTVVEVLDDTVCVRPDKSPTRDTYAYWYCTSDCKRLVPKKKIEGRRVWITEGALNLIFTEGARSALVSERKFVDTDVEFVEVIKK